MAGTIVADTLSDGAGNTTSMDNTIYGSAKAWVNFVGTTTSGSATINASYNVSSVTVNGAGNWTVNFSTALADANYAMAGSYRPINTGIYGMSVSQYSGGTLTTGACQIQLVNGTSSGTTTNGQNVFAIFHR
jgi:hypothetical protein